MISEPFMKDPFFIRSVILICEHNDEGSFGYKLNSPCNKANIKLLDNDILENLHFGGPVENEYLNFIHSCENPKINSNKNSLLLLFQSDLWPAETNCLHPVMPIVPIVRHPLALGLKTFREKE